MRSLRRIAAMAAASALTLGALAGCAAQPAESDDPVTLRYWSWAPGIEKIVAIWNDENPDVQVEVNTSTGGADIVAKLSAAKEAGDLPDLSNTTYENLPNLIVNGIAADVSDAMEPYRDQVAPAALDLTTFDGISYAVPQGTGPMFLFYRADVLEQHGIAVPTTWDEYAQAARDLAAAAPGTYLATFAPNDAPVFNALSQQAGAEWWSLDDGEWSVDIDDEPSQRVADYWNGLVDEGVLATFKTNTPEWQAAVANGTLASWISAVWAPPLIAQNAPDTAGLWGAVRIPQWQAGERISGVVGGSGTIVTTATEHPEQAREFAVWLNNHEDAINAYIENASNWPAILAGRELPALRESVSPVLAEPDTFFDLAAEIDAEIVPVTFGPNTASATSAFNDIFSDAVSRGTPFRDALTALQDSVVADMNNLGYQVD